MGFDSQANLCQTGGLNGSRSGETRWGCTWFIFSQDGAANATYTMEFYQRGARGNGVHLVESHVKEILCLGNRVTRVKIFASQII